MRLKSTAALGAAALIATCVNVVPSVSVATPSVKKPSASVARLPMSFSRDGDTYVARGNGYAAVLDRNGLDLTLSKTDAREHLTMQFAGARLAAPRAASKLPGTVSYMIGNDRSKWRTGLATFARVVYPEVWPGIDVAFYGSGTQIEYDFVMRPRADSRNIALRFNRQSRVDARGGLVLGPLSQPVPVATQNGTRVSARYVIDGNVVKIALGEHDARAPLVIDPPLVFGTFWGGSAEESVTDLVSDAMGQTYFIGKTASTGFHGNNASGLDAFVAKLNAAGTSLLYTTFLGGSTNEFANGLAVRNGEAFVVGTTGSGDFPTSVSPFDATLGGVEDAFVVHLNAAGSMALYSTYLGGSSGDSGNGIAVDSAGNAFVTGRTFSANFPTVNPAQASPLGNGDAFAATFNQQGSALTYSTFLGGSQLDAGNKIQVDASGNAYIGSSTSSTDFPLAAPISPALGGSNSITIGSNESVPNLAAGSVRTNIAGAPFTVADFNGDGLLDMAAADVYSSTIVWDVDLQANAGLPVLSVYQGLGDGTFGSPLMFALGSRRVITDELGWAIATGNLNNDGKPDIVFAGPLIDASPSFTAHTGVITLINTTVANNLAFGAQTSNILTPTTSPMAKLSVAVGDINGDAVGDVVTANNADTSFYTWLGATPGTFGTPTASAIGGSPRSIALGTSTFSANGTTPPDSFFDVFVTAVYPPGAPFFGAQTAEIYSNQGGGVYNNAADIVVTTGTTPNKVVVADLNQDGTSDFVTANADGLSLTSFIARTVSPYGYFTATTLPIGGNPVGLTTMNFNNDGKIDLGLVKQGGGVMILNNTTTNGASSTTFLSLFDLRCGQDPFDSMGAGELINSENQDRLLISGCSNGLGDGALTKLGPTGNLLRSTHIGGPGSDAIEGLVVSGSTLTLSMTTDSKKIDMAPTPVLTPVGSNIGVLQLDTNMIAVGHANVIGGGGIENAGGIARLANGQFALTGDTLGFGTNHVAGAGNVMHTSLNGFATTDLLFPGLTQPSSSAAFVDPLTGFEDLAIGDMGSPTGNPGSAQVVVGFNNGSGVFSNFVAFPFGVAGHHLQVAGGDINGDGFEEFVVFDPEAGTFKVFFNDGNNTFTQNPSTSATPNPSSIGVGDFNNDGKSDILWQHDPAVETDFSLSYYLFNSTSSSFTPGSLTTDVRFTGGVHVAAGDVNGDGFSDIIATGTQGSSNFGSVAVFANNAGVFLPTPDLLMQTGLNPTTVTVGDVTGDTKPDIIIGNSGAPSITSTFITFVNNGSGPAPSFAIGQITGGAGATDVLDLRIASVDGDASMDAVTESFDGTFRTFTGNNDGTFAAGSSFDCGAVMRPVWNDTNTVVARIAGGSTDGLVTTNCARPDAAFVLLSDDVINMMFATLHGGTGDESGSAIAVDPSGSVTIGGQTFSNTIPVDPIQPTYGGGGDGFLAKFDRAPPTVPAMTQPSSKFQRARTFTVAWGNSTDLDSTPIYDIRYRAATYGGSLGSFGTLVAGTTTHSRSFTGAPGNTYCFSARARESTGLMSAYGSEKCATLGLDDRSLSASTGWTRRTGTGWYLNTFTETLSWGKTLSRTGVRARQLAVEVGRCSTCGRIQVFFNGVLRATFNLHASSNQANVVLLLPAFASLSTGTVTIKSATSGMPIRIDGISAAKT